jgi:hypothetical protein
MWTTIWAATIAKGGGDRVVRIEAEFGPAPYMPSLPFTQVIMMMFWRLGVRGVVCFMFFFFTVGGLNSVLAAGPFFAVSFLT